MPISERSKVRPSELAELSSLFEPYVWAWFEDTFKKPSPPQTASWPKIAEGKNTLILSPTGSGKTLAAFLWCINELFRMCSQEKLEDSVYVVYVSPLKALNNDIQKNLVQPLKGIKRYAQKLGIEVADVRSEVRTGDTSVKKRAEMVRRPPHILITTPESLFIILATKKFRLSFRKVKYVIADEIHAMADNKRGVHLSLSLERLQHLVGRDLVRIGLSATQKPLDEIARFLVGVNDAGKPRECEIVDVGGRKNLNVSVMSPVDNLLEAQFDAIWSSAYDKMISMAKEHETTLIFTNSRYRTERAALRLNELGADSSLHVGAHHGSLSRRVRLDMENKLKKGLLDALVATSSLELGIDVGSIDLVCQIQSPKSVSRGMQRIGRAGHLLDATSEGRLLVTDRDDLVESAVLVKAIMNGQIDTTRIPTNCLDVLAQHIVGAVAADDWNAKQLFSLCRRSYCYRNLKREDYDRVLDMLSGNYVFDMEQPPYPKILWDKVNNVLSPERAARLMAFRASGTIPDIEDYDVYFEQRKTRVGQLDEGFVERLHTGDVFILGSTSWRVLGFDRKRVIVEDIYGRAPTIPFWMGERDSRTYDLGILVGQFRREMERHISKGDPIGWLQKEYYVDENGARATHEYFKEQFLTTSELPSDELILVEHFHDELGHQQIIVHSSFGVRVNDAWAMALCEAIMAQYGFQPQDATVDDGILVTLPIGKEINPQDLLELVTLDNVDELIEGALVDAPVFSSRFRHNAVRSLMVLRHYRDRRTPVWLQSLRSSALLEACREDKNFPLIVETLRECMNEALDVPNLRRVLNGLESGEIKVKTLETKIPSPFAHSLLLLGQYGEMGAIPTRERRSRLMHLRHEVLRQILDEETLRDLLDEDAIETVDAQAQYIHPHRKARNANELARVLLDLGDLVDVHDDDISLLDRTKGDSLDMLSELASAHRAVLVPITTVETNRERWIATENLPLYRGAFGTEIELGDVDRQIIQLLSEKGPLPLSQIAVQDDVEGRLESLVNAYEVLRLPKEGRAEYIASRTWVPDHILGEKKERQEARLALVRRFVRSHGPVTKYEIMERYGFASKFVEQALAGLLEEGVVAKGEYAPTKSFPQWCHKGNLERIHRLTLNRLRKEMEPATGVEYADFLVRWQHVHPETRLAGIDGLRNVVRQIQGQENYQAVFERDIFPSRVKDYRPSMLDRLCYSGKVVWRRFDYRSLRRGQIGFCLREDQDWVAVNPDETEIDLEQWDEDIHEACAAVREFLKERGACFFDDIVKGVGMDWRLILRAIWHLVWTGEATTDSFESIRHADITTGLSGIYDLPSKPQRKGVTLDRIARQMVHHRKLDPRLGRWTPTERLVPSSLEQADHDERMLKWADLLLKRYGIVSRESLELEVSAPRWGNLRRALVRMELLGRIRRGFFVEELSGEQFAYPEALEALRRAKLRFHGKGENKKEAWKGEEDSPIDEPMVLLNSVDPASPFGAMFPATDEVGEELSFSRTPQRYLVIQGGQPILTYERQGSIMLLADLPIESAEEAMRTLIQIIDQPARFGSYREIVIRDWNGHPIDVSPARHLLVKMGFIEEGRKEFVYDGIHKPDQWVVAEAGKEMPELLERAGKERAPVKYDAEWIISRSPSQIQHKVGELIEMLERILPEEFEIVYQPRNFTVHYRGVRCLRPSIQQKKIRLSHFYHKDWWTLRPILIDPETDLNSSEFISLVLGRFEKSRRYIDSQLDRKPRPTPANPS